MDEITRLEVELDAVLRELLDTDPDAIARILLRIHAVTDPVVDRLAS